MELEPFFFFFILIRKVQSYFKDLMLKRNKLNIEFLYYEKETVLPLNSYILKLFYSFRIILRTK